MFQLCFPEAFLCAEYTRSSWKSGKRRLKNYACLMHLMRRLMLLCKMLNAYFRIFRITPKGNSYLDFISLGEVEREVTWCNFGNNLWRNLCMTLFPFLLCSPLWSQSLCNGYNEVTFCTCWALTEESEFICWAKL